MTRFPRRRRGDVLAFGLLSAGCTALLGIDEHYLPKQDASVLGGAGGSGNASTGGSLGSGGSGQSGSGSGGVDSGGSDGTTDDASVHDAPDETAGAGGTPQDAAVDNDLPPDGEPPDGGPLSCPTAAKGPELVRVVGPAGKAYCIDATEVTNAQYAGFASLRPIDVQFEAPIPECSRFTNLSFVPAGNWPPLANAADRPVAGVDWCDAYMFCRWADKRLCGKIGGGSLTLSESDTTSGQWFNACSRGGTRSYPYGSSFSSMTCNGSDFAGAGTIAVKSASGCEGGYEGIFDLSGNVAEWEDACFVFVAGYSCNLRGGSHTSSQAASLACESTTTARRGVLEQPADAGFRCCKD